MPHMQLIVDGETVYDQTIEGWMAPPAPDLIGVAVDQRANPNIKPPPWLKAIIVTAMGDAIVERLLKDPRFQPLNTQIVKRPTGWTIHMDLPRADFDPGALPPIELPAAPDHGNPAD